MCPKSFQQNSVLRSKYFQSAESHRLILILPMITIYQIFMQRFNQLIMRFAWKIWAQQMGKNSLAKFQFRSWLRLSKEGEASEPHKLNDETSFKIGTTSTYICKKQYGVVKQKFNADCCIICCENDRDALYMPCKHNAACLRCSKSFKECPICRYKIEDIIRIYKN